MPVSLGEVTCDLRGAVGQLQQLQCLSAVSLQASELTSSQVFAAIHSANDKGRAEMKGLQRCVERMRRVSEWFARASTRRVHTCSQQDFVRAVNSISSLRFRLRRHNSVFSCQTSLSSHRHVFARQTGVFIPRAKERTGCGATGVRFYCIHANQHERNVSDSGRDASPSDKDASGVTQSSKRFFFFLLKTLG